MTVPILAARGLGRNYEVARGFAKPKGVIRALNGVDFDLQTGRTLGVVGESGCGKSTLARVLTMIEVPDTGYFEIAGERVHPKDWRRLRSQVQIVFQNPYASLNPRQTVGQTLKEPLRNFCPELSKSDREKRAREMLTLVGLGIEHFDRFPHMFSGGQRQRIAIARALMIKPRILILDEPVSALDPSVQSQILNLLIDLQGRLRLTYLFISHNLSVVQHMADEVLIMYFGRAVELGKTSAFFEQPRHPYTQALIESAPIADPNRQRKHIRLEGELPSPLYIPQGCAFAPRCRYAQKACQITQPSLGTNEHRVACHFPLSTG